MKRKWNLWSGYSAIVFLLASCVSAVHVKKDDNANFGQYKTFAWIDKDDKDKHDRDRSNDLTEQKIRQAVNKELEKSAGWKETKNHPDVLLSYDVLVERSVQQRSDPVYSQSFFRTFYNPYSRRLFNVYYPSQFMGYDSYDVHSREGTITISMIDANTDKTVWQGWTTDEVNSKNLSNKEIQNSVRAIFRKFDVAKN